MRPLPCDRSRANRREECRTAVCGRKALAERTRQTLCAASITNETAGKDEVSKRAADRAGQRPPAWRYIARAAPTTSRARMVRASLASDLNIAIADPPLHPTNA
jgi:hypothetical protein